MNKDDIAEIVEQCIVVVKKYDIPVVSSDFYPTLTRASFDVLREHFPIKNRYQHPHVVVIQTGPWAVMFTRSHDPDDKPRRLPPTENQSVLFDKILDEVKAIFNSNNFDVISLGLGFSIMTDDFQATLDKFKISPSNDLDNFAEIKTHIDYLKLGCTSINRWQ